MGEFVARIRAMLRRREEFHPDIISFGDLSLNLQSGEISVGEQSFQLPKQEYRLMEQLMLNHTMFMSTEDLLVKAWGLSAARAICENFNGSLKAEYSSTESIRFIARL